jgi:glycosyltransferase involved in cell wall biosynthesis
MRDSDALILYSRYETFGCVIIEANASGIPVIVPDIKVMHELVSEDNGMLIKPNDAEALAEGLEDLILSKEKFDNKRIAIRAKEKFSYQVVGKKINDLYKEILGQQSTF